jgi:hypothetical protein
MKRDGPDFSEFPKAVPSASNSPQKYQLVASYFAVHGVHDAAGPVLEFAPEHIAVYPIDRFQQISQTAPQISPVYSLREGGSFAVPTGRVFVRFSAESNFKDHADRFRDAGYEIDQTLAYAPNAGWLRPSSSSIASSLASLEKLSTIPGVENVEPQMLQKAVRKT